MPDLRHLSSSKTGHQKAGVYKQKQGLQVLLLKILLSPKLFCHLFKAEIPQVGLHPWANLIDNWPVPGQV